MKRWIRRNRHVNPDLVKAVKQHQKWPSFKITRRHPITKQYLSIDTRCLNSKTYIQFLRQCDKEYKALELLAETNLHSIDKELIDKIIAIFKDDNTDIE